MQSSMTLSQPLRPLWKGLRGVSRSAIGIMLAAGIMGTGISGHLSLDRSSSVAAVASTVSHSSPLLHHAQSLDSVSGRQDVLTAQASAPQTAQPLPDGRYLYGQSPDAGVLGAAYMVFDVSGTDVSGAFYMPHSSFDCFRGSFQGNELALTIRSSYEQEDFSYSVALVTQEAIASDGAPQLSTQLEGYHAITDLSEGDRTILQTCQATPW